MGINLYIRKYIHFVVVVVAFLNKYLEITLEEKQNKATQIEIYFIMQITHLYIKKAIMITLQLN